MGRRLIRVKKKKWRVFVPTDFEQYTTEVYFPESLHKLNDDFYLHDSFLNVVKEPEVGKILFCSLIYRGKGLDRGYQYVEIPDEVYTKVCLLKLKGEIE